MVLFSQVTTDELMAEPSSFSCLRTSRQGGFKADQFDMRAFLLYCGVLLSRAT
jgi:hypothetical protein